jgi:cell division protein FtsA
MEEKARYAVGIDLGSSKIRVVIGARTGEQVSVVGYGEANSEGVRRGAISDLQTPLNPLIEAIHAAENMSGYDVSGASLSINSGSIASTYVEGMVLTQEAQGRGGLSEDDLMRVEEAAMKGKVPNNREILDFVPFEYIVDGQGNVRDPLGMTCSRLEIRANAVSAMMPDVNNLRKLCEMADNLNVHALVPTAMAAAEAIVTNHQRENGVGVVNFGSNTTSIAVYDEGELQFVNTIPMGSNDVTRDLATILAATPDLAEEVKLRYADASFMEGKDVTVKRGRDEYVFGRSEINEVVEARLDEIFERVAKCLKAAGYDKRLPEGLILTGGGAKMRNLDIYVRSKLGMAVRIGEIQPFIESSAPEVLKAEYATAIGLMLRDMDMSEMDGGHKRRKGAKKPLFGGGGLSKIFKMFR